jgi:hypothetical protein
MGFDSGTGTQQTDMCLKSWAQFYILGEWATLSYFAASSIPLFKSKSNAKMMLLVQN